MTVCGGLGFAGLGLAAGIAQAHVVGDWDMNTCHDYRFSDEDFPPGPHMQAETGPKPRDLSCPPWATIFSGPAQCGGL